MRNDYNYENVDTLIFVGVAAGKSAVKCARGLT